MLFSARKRRAERGDAPDVYQYDEIPTKLRIQLHRIFDKALGYYYEPGGYDMNIPNNNNGEWRTIHDKVCQEHGRHFLSADYLNPKVDTLRYLEAAPTDEALDVVEACCFAIQFHAERGSQYELEKRAINVRPSKALEEVNFRFREAGVGYQLEGGRIVRVDSLHIHAEVVKPAFGLLSDPRFAGPESEFRDAHQHYRAGEYRDAITDANNAFESTMKCVCKIKNWDFDKNARASDLLKVLKKNGLWPDYLDATFDQLQATLASGLPTVRNKEGGHGQGDENKTVPEHVAAYALHLAAASIVYIVEASTYEE